MMICILGNGPAGMLAAHAVAQVGNEPVILSRSKTASQIFGAQFLHRNIPSITKSDPDFMVRILKAGTARGYAHRVYGDPDVSVSFDRYTPGEMPAWDLKSAYHNLLARYDDYIFAVGEIDKSTLHHLIGNYPIIYSTLPLEPLCKDPRHNFGRREIWIQHTTEPPTSPIAGNCIVFNGHAPDAQPPWYRFSQLNGHQSWEFTQDPYENGVLSIAKGFKVLGTDCDCWPEIRRIGRFGTWERGVLTHHAYEAVSREMLEL